MEELKNLLHKLQFDYYEHGANMHTIIPDSDIKPILEYIKNNFIPLEPPVSQENGGRECPLCGGKNKKEFGGNDKCFHCENETCGFVQCEQSADDVIYMVSKRIKKFYKG